MHLLYLYFLFLQSYISFQKEAQKSEKTFVMVVVYYFLKTI